jgi:outer membrane protein assembly factor BamB
LNGRGAYVLGFDGTILAVDLEGKVRWKNADYPFYGQHGLASSPVLWGDLLIIARDGSSSGENKKLGWQEPWDQASLVALERSTGKQRWKSVRGLSRIAHVVPVVWTNASGRALLFSGAGDVVQCHDPATGERLWSVLNKGEGVVPSPAVGDGMVFTACGFSGRDSIKAFRADLGMSSEDERLAWELRRGMPRVPSLLYVAPYLYALSDNGQVTCVEGQTGRVVWQEKLEGNFSASPLIAGGRIYLLSDSGETTVIAAGPEWKVISKNNLGEKCQATPAISQGHIFIRSEKHLFAIRGLGKLRE